MKEWAAALSRLLAPPPDAPPAIRRALAAARRTAAAARLAVAEGEAADALADVDATIANLYAGDDDDGPEAADFELAESIEEDVQADLLEAVWDYGHTIGVLPPPWGEAAARQPLTAPIARAARRPVRRLGRRVHRRRRTSTRAGPDPDEPPPAAGAIGLRRPADPKQTNAPAASLRRGATDARDRIATFRVAPAGRAVNGGRGVPAA